MDKINFPGIYLT